MEHKNQHYAQCNKERRAENNVCYVVKGRRAVYFETFFTYEFYRQIPSDKTACA